MEARIDVCEKCGLKALKLAVAIADMCPAVHRIKIAEREGSYTITLAGELESKYIKTHHMVSFSNVKTAKRRKRCAISLYDYRQNARYLEGDE